MLVLRLARTGRRNQPKYRLVVAEHSKPLDGKVVEVVGHYNPTDHDKPFVIDKEAISAWLGKGATPSNTVAKLLNKEGFNLPVHERPVRPARKAPKERVVPAPKAPEGEIETAPPPPTIPGEAPVSEEAPVTEEAPVEAPVEEAPAEPVVEAAPTETAAQEEKSE